MSEKTLKKRCYNISIRWGIDCTIIILCGHMLVEILPIINKKASGLFFLHVNHSVHCHLFLTFSIAHTSSILLCEFAPLFKPCSNVYIYIFTKCKTSKKEKINVSVDKV
jgi:hypothetical protein